MNLSIERGKHLAADFACVDFLLKNNDIVSALTKAPLHIRRVGDNRYAGKIFGIAISGERLDHKYAPPQGAIRSLSDIRMPFGLGRTYVKSSNTYFAVDKNITSLALKVELEVTGIMRLYILIRNRAVYNYIDRICTDIETAARTIKSDDYKESLLLSDEQKARINEFVSHAKSLPADDIITESLDASVSIAVVRNITVVEADAVMPDKHFITARHEFSYDPKKSQHIYAAAGRLARINNPAFAVRGEAEHENLDIEFRQAAFEFGHNLFNEYFSGNLSGVMPILTHHGKQTFLHFALDEKLESLPWEALHDGKDFLSTKLRFARSIGLTKQRSSNKDSIVENFRILLIGSDSRGDLPGVTVEAETIGQILSRAGDQKIEVLTGQQANRQNVIASLTKGKFNVLHFSGHSVFNQQYPYQSYLELAQGGKLYLHELDQLNNNAAGGTPFDLVFLNSCQSGRTGIDQTSGRNLSLCRVLREAGVENVIGMLWNVTDEAAVQVASTFYEYIATGRYIDVTEALRQTRCKVAMDRAWQDGSWLAPVLYA